MRKIKEFFNNLFNVLHVFTNNEQEENIEQDIETKCMDEESEWTYMDSQNEEHRLSIFYDDLSHQYRIVDMNNKSIYPEMYDNKDDALDEIYHKSTRVIGLIVYNGISIFK